MKKLARTSLLAIISLLFSANLFAQANGTLNFQVMGIETGDRSVVSFGSDAYLETKTITQDGDYVFENLPTGKHFIKIEAAGYNLPNAQTVIVKEDGSVDPVVGIKLVITKMSGDSDEWTHHWSEDVSNSGYTKTSYINNPPTIEFLGKQIVPSNVPSVGILYSEYDIILSDDEEIWSLEYAYRLLETIKTIPIRHWDRPKLSKFILTKDHLYLDIDAVDVGDGLEVRISQDAFFYANPFLVSLDGVRGRFFSKRLHHALVNYITDFGREEGRVDHILRERFGCSIFPPDYTELTRYTTGEDAGRFQKFMPGEAVSIINMFEEMPEGMHKIPQLKYLIRRVNGHDHPIHPNAAAVAWQMETGYIEFMEKAFGGTTTSEATLRLIIHEKAHYLWHFIFSKELKDDWIEIGGWYEDPNAPDGWATTKTTEFVSSYAHGINPDEDMAESIAYYLKNPEKFMSRSLPKYEFIRDRVMHGVRYISKIPDHLTFEVLNLFPDYDYPGKIKRIDVRVSGAPEDDKTVTVEIELNNMEGFNDGASGGHIRPWSPIFTDTEGNKQQHDAGMWLSPVNGNPHILRGETTISKYSKSGFWVVGQIIVNDIHGNQRFEGRNDFVWNMFVNNPLEDLEPPQYIENSLNYQLLDTVVWDNYNDIERNAQILRVTWEATDNIGIGGTVIRLMSDGSYSWGDSWGRYDAQTQTATVDFLITEYFPNANYFTTFMMIKDFAGNGKNIRFSDSPLDRPIQYIYVETINPDTVAPEIDLNRMTVFAEPTNPENPDGETKVTITYFARDNKSGLDQVTYKLRDPQGIDHRAYHYHRNFYTPYFAGDPTVWEKYVINIILPKGSAPGIWGLAEMGVMDKARNERNYNFVETIIFIPDDSMTDFVLFANLEDDTIASMKITSESNDVFGFNYRIINEDTGEELSGNVAANNIHTANLNVDVSDISDGILLVIVQIRDENDQITAIRNVRLQKGTVSIQATVEYDIFLYPNPVKNDLYIQSEHPVQKIEVYTVAGDLVMEKPAFTEKIEMRALLSGVYFVRIYTENKIIIRKVIKE